MLRLRSVCRRLLHVDAVVVQKPCFGVQLTNQRARLAKQQLAPLTTYRGAQFPVPVITNGAGE